MNTRPLSRRRALLLPAPLLLAVSIFLFVPLASTMAHAQTPPTFPAVAAVAMPEPADIAAPKLDKDGKIDARFQQMHESFLARGKSGPIGVLFLGASIMERWQTVGKDVWEARYGKDNPADFGIGGDKTENILWRIDQGELDNISPKVVVIMVGSNNIGIGSTEALIRAEQKIIAEVRAKLPNTRILSLGIFPRGAHPNNPQTASMRAEVKAVNAALAKLDDGKATRVLDIGDKFLDAKGIITKEMMPDQLHPTPLGYAIWANAIQSTLDEMMK